MIGDLEPGLRVVADHHRGRPVPPLDLPYQLVQQLRPDRVQAGVRLVEEQDLRLEHQRPGEAGPFAHPGRELVRHLLLGPGEADLGQPVHHDLPDLALGLPGVLAKREGDVVVEAHGAEQRAFLEQHPHLPSQLQQLVVLERRNVPAVHDDVPGVGPEQTDEVPEQDRLAGARGTDDDADLALRDVAVDPVQHPVTAEGLPHGDAANDAGRGLGHGPAGGQAGPHERR